MKNALSSAVEAATQAGIGTIIVASTTGETAVRLSEMLQNGKFRQIVVTHDEGRPPGARRFRDENRTVLKGRLALIYTYESAFIFFEKILKKLKILPWDRHLAAVKKEYGTGIKVCHLITRMLARDGIVGNERVVTIAGKGKGADSAALFSVRSPRQWPLLEKLIVRGD